MNFYYLSAFTAQNQVIKIIVILYYAGFLKPKVLITVYKILGRNLEKILLDTFQMSNS